MALHSPTPHPPLSAAAEEALATLERLVGAAAGSPGDLLPWLSVLMDEHRDVLLAPDVQPQLDILRTMLAGPEVGTGRFEPITRAEIAAQAAARAVRDGRPITSSKDVVRAVLALIIQRMERGTGDGEPAVTAPPPVHASGEGGAEAAPHPADTLPASMAAEEMLEGLCAALKIEGDEAADALRWLDALLVRHGGLIGDEAGVDKLRELKRWGEEREHSGRPNGGVGIRQVRAAASESVREAGRPLITPHDVAMAIVRLALEAAARMAAEPDDMAPEPPEVQATLEPAEEQAAPEAAEAAEVRGTPKAAVDAPSPEYRRTRTFRLFVSSTFKDLEAERNVLQQVAFPRVRDFCARHGARFQAIDLRWGVSEEAAVDQQTMDICLGEIERCRQVTPKPNFLVLLGDRYGWIPPPARLPAEEFEGILDRLQEPDDRNLLERWYRKDLNAIPPEYRLRPRSGEMEAYRTWQAWTPEEEKIRDAFQKALGDDGFALSPHRLHHYQASATEQEVLAGVLAVVDPQEKVFCFFREVRDYPEDEQGNPTRGAEAFLSSDPDERRRLRSLKERLASHLPEGSILTREVRWREACPELTAEYLAEVAEWVAASLEGAILRELERPPAGPDAEVRVPEWLQPDSGLAEEVWQHLRFAEERSRFFVGREDLLQEIAEYLSAATPQPLAVVGGGGSGKSTLLAEAARRLEEAGGREVRVIRFIGATPGSSDSRFFLESLCREIALGYGNDPGELPGQYEDLVPKLGQQLELATKDRPLVLMMDSLDQLSEPALGLTWIPFPLPPHVRLVVSARLEELGGRLERRDAVCREIGPLSRAHGAVLLQTWLKEARPSRQLQPLQAAAVLHAFVESDGNPLYLKLAAEEARRWPAWGVPGSAVPRESPVAPLATGVPGIIGENLLGRLSHNDNHGLPLVSRALGYIAASRYGLTEDELIEVLSRDPEVYSWFLRGAEHIPQDLAQRAASLWFGGPSDGGIRVAEPHERAASGKGPEARDADVVRRLKLLRDDPARLRTFLSEELDLNGLQLPVVLWSRLFFDLEPYLTERRAEGGDLLSFYHRELGEVASQEFLAGEAGTEIHGRLADYFRIQADPGSDALWEGAGVRGFSELPFHLTKALRWDDLYEVLTDFVFLEQKAARVGVTERIGADGEGEILYTGVFQLQDDFQRAVESMPAGKTATEDVHPLIVTAVDFGDGLVVHCPWCNARHPLVRDWLGHEIRCPNEGCRGPLKVNPFTVGGGR